MRNHSNLETVGAVFFSSSLVNEWQHMTAEVYIVLAIFKLISIVKKLSLRVFITKSYLFLVIS